MTSMCIEKKEMKCVYPHHHSVSLSGVNEMWYPHYHSISLSGVNEMCVSILSLNFIKWSQRNVWIHIIMQFH